MGSEMCIRDRAGDDQLIFQAVFPAHQLGDGDLVAAGLEVQTCLLYTSDAADERSSVDLGGRRIIKKKKKRVRADISKSVQ